MRRIAATLSAAVTAAVVGGAASFVMMTHPATPLPPEWNPAAPLDLSGPLTPVTRWKLRGAQEGAACYAALDSIGAAFDRLPSREVSGACHIRDRLLLTGLDGAALDPLETRCTTALRLALWHRYGLEPLARQRLGAGVAGLHHLSSYNCREIRTPGGGGRMSTHATADAVDITGVTLTDGRRLRLIDDWGDGDAGRFLKEARDASCDWFATTLGPDYNALHSDHFHLQSRGWGLCR